MKSEKIIAIKMDVEKIIIITLIIFAVFISILYQKQNRELNNLNIRLSQLQNNNQNNKKKIDDLESENSDLENEIRNLEGRIGYIEDVIRY